MRTRQPEGDVMPMSVTPVNGGGFSRAAAVTQQQEAAKDLTRQLVGEPALKSLDMAQRVVGLSVQMALDASTTGLGANLDVMA